MTRLVVVVPNWNGVSHLPECLRALRAQTFWDFETIVVDNGSTDDSLSLLGAEYPEVRVIRNGENRGFAGAVNEGIRGSDSSLVVLLNNDTHAEPDWLERLVAAADRHPDADSFAALMVFYDTPAFVNTAGDWFRLTALAAFNRGLGRPREEYARPVWLFGASAGAAMYRRSFFDDVGLFDERFFLMHEDTDLNMRALLLGKRCLYVPDAVVRHKLSASISTHPSLEMSRLRWRNEALVVAKDFPASLLPLAVLLAPLYEFRGTIALRPSRWGGNLERLRLLPARLKAGWDGMRMGLASRGSLPPRRISVREFVARLGRVYPA